METFHDTGHDDGLFQGDADGRGRHATDITDDITWGELKALIDTRDTYANEFINKLDRLSSAPLSGT